MVWKQVYDLVNNSSDMLWQIFKHSFSFCMYKPKTYQNTLKQGSQQYKEKWDWRNLFAPEVKSNSAVQRNAFLGPTAR